MSRPRQRRRTLVQGRFELRKLLFSGSDRAFAAFDRRSLELDRSELLPSSGQLLFRPGELGLALRELADEARQLGLPGLELGGSEAEHPLDGRSRITEELLASLELCDRLVEPRGVLLELAATVSEQLLEAVLGARAGREHAPDEPAARLVVGALVFGARHSSVSVARCDAGEPILSRRVRNDPPARRMFVDRSVSPARVTRTRRVKPWHLETDIPRMDAQGARLLAARIRAGVAIGARVELVEAPLDDSGLCAGDRGIVDQIDEHGHVFVTWDRGFATEIDPGHTPITTLAA